MDPAGRVAPLRAERDRDVRDAAPLQHALRRLGARKIGHLHARQELRLGFVRGDPVQAGVEFPGQLRGGRRVENHVYALRVRGPRRPQHRLKGRLKLEEEGVGPFDVRRERRDVLRGKRTVRAKRHGDAVLPLPVHEDEGRAGRGGFVDDEPRVDALGLQAPRSVASEQVVPDLGDEHALSSARGEPRHGDGLICTLPARVHHERTAAHGFARHGNLRAGNHHVRIRAAQYDNHALLLSEGAFSIA